MAFSYTVTKARHLGVHRYVYGTFTNASTDTDSGGAITTGLASINAYGANVTNQFNAPAPIYTISGGTLTLGTGRGANGNWWAIGDGGG